MNLFENLQMMESAQVLQERDSLSVSEYNKLKIALNKNNIMKANFILHPGSVEVYDYKMKIRIYGAFRSFEQSRPSIHSFGRQNDITNDRITKNGVGIQLYIVTINLIDETVTFFDSYDYDIDRYLSRYERQLIDDGSVKSGDMDLNNLKDSIKTVINNSKIDLEKALLSKNFIYNLTGKKKTKPDNSSDYNLDLESITLKEDFDSSMPNWLMRTIKMNNFQRNSGHKDVNYNMPLDTMKWVVEPFPEKGKLNDIGDNEYIALLIDRSGDRHAGEYIVYFPAAYIGNHEKIEINGRNRSIDSMSLRALAPYVKEFAHTVGNEKSMSDIRQKRQDRGIAQAGSVDRKLDDDNWWTNDRRDKSGYIVDPNKYKRLLAQNKQGEYASRLEDLYTVLTDVRTNIKTYLSNDEVIPMPGKKDYRKDGKFNRGTNAYKEYSQALNYYSDALETLEKIKDGKRDGWNESFESFEKEVKQAEMHTVNCLNILEKE